MSSRPYRYGGAEATVALHARYLREFWQVWREADERGVELPATDNPNYASRERLLLHVMRASAGYLIWMCEQLGQDHPGLERRPDPEGFASRAECYMEGVLEAWDQHLRDLTEDQADSTTYAATWGTHYCIDAMLEHAVMHPIRHSYQLRRLMDAR